MVARDALVDLVVVVHGAPVETLAMLRSLEHVEVPYTLTIVRNDQMNESDRAIAKGLKVPAVSPNCVYIDYIHSESNIGYARACNRGSKVGDAETLVLLNSDVEFLPGAGVLWQMHEFLQDNPTVAVAGPKTIDEVGRLTGSGIVDGGGGKDRHRFWLKIDNGQADDVSEVKSVSGAAYFVRRDVWNELSECPDFVPFRGPEGGGFLPTRHYYEETYFSYHARHHGYKVMHVGTASMVHKWHRSSKIGSVEGKVLRDSRSLFVSACRAHGIEANT